MILEGKQIVIVGGSSGVGLGVAAHVLRRGAKVTIVGRNEQRLRQAAAHLDGVRVVAADIADEPSARRIFEGMDRVDHVYISAGTHQASHVFENSMQELHSVVNERLWGVVHTVRHAKPLMSGGSITLTSGALSVRPRPGAGIQTAALAAVEALVPALALEMAPIRVNALRLGTVRTLLLDAIYGAGVDKHLASRAAALPIGRVGEPSDVAEAVEFLMTNGYVTGTVLNLDGGARLVPR